MLIAFAGLPGTGKTTIARRLARRLTATYLRIDAIEQTLIKPGTSTAELGPMGYLAAYAIAADNLQLGMTVIADSVNCLSITRNAWRTVARDAGVACFEIELICSRKQVHRSRLESRIPDMPGHALPTWKDVLERRCDPWDSPRLVIDTTTMSADEAVETILQDLPRSQQGDPT